MKSTVIVVCLTLITAVSSFSQDALTTKVDEFIKTEMERQKIPGVSLAVVKDGKPLIVKGYGLANVEHQVPVKPETIFQSGSVGKQFTATAIMMLVEDGKIGLDEKIGKYLGEVPESWANITVRHLLSHTGGMTGYQQDFDFRKDYTEDEILKRAKEAPVAFKPGERWQYSNLGYVTLGVIISKVTGKFYGDFLQERIFKPLGMTTARILNEEDIIPNRAMGYRLAQGQLKHQAWVSPTVNTTGDGSLYLTALDMIKWEDALATGKLMKKSSYEEMWTPIKLSDGKPYPLYGFGWFLRTINGKRVIEHGGAWQGFKAHILRVPESRLSVIVFANLIQANQDKLANGVAVIVDPELKLKPITDPDPALTAKTKELFISIVEGKPDLERFTPNLQTAITRQQEQTSATFKSLGAMRSFSLLERMELGDTVRYTYRLEYPAASFFLRAVVNKEGKLSGFALQAE